MENATIKKITNEYYKVIPDSGYHLVNKQTLKEYSEAVTKKVSDFIVVVDEETE